jgi:ABC-type transport system involved in cytochrome c biogenesis ATPase subunit
MLTKLTIRNFKRFEAAEIELGQAAVFVGPNNSGKTTALQALALWELGVRRWNERRSDSKAERRPGVAINRKDIFAAQVPNAKMLWRDLRAHSSAPKEKNGKTIKSTVDVFIDIVVEGVTADLQWECGLEFDFANEESIYCRPLRLNGSGEAPRRMPMPEHAAGVRVAYLPPMSGLSDREFLKQTGEINYQIGLGQTGQVLRNLCYRMAHDEAFPDRWTKIITTLGELFWVKLNMPELSENAEILFTYEDPRGASLDISCAGRGLLQTLLLLCHLYANPRSVLLLDEPDAHLEVLRQQQVYRLVTETAQAMGSQVIVASHSEKILELGADKDLVVGFMYRGVKRIDDRSDPKKKHLLESLRKIGFVDFHQADLRRWVLYAEGGTDLSILQSLATKLNHQSGQAALAAPFFHEIGGNDQRIAHRHFDTLKHSLSNLVAVAILDRDSEDREHQSAPSGLTVIRWRRREIENYLDPLRTLPAYARGQPTEDMFSQHESEKREQLMIKIMRSRIPPRALENDEDAWWINTKMTDDFLDLVFEEYFTKLNLPNMMRKTDYHELARIMEPNRVHPEVIEVLDAIGRIAPKAE